MTLYGYFNKAPKRVTLDIKMSEYITNIAVAVKLVPNRKRISIEARARILAVWDTVLNFISAENFFRPMLDTHYADYVQVVKETLKFILVPAFTAGK